MLKTARQRCPGKPRLTLCSPKDVGQTKPVPLGSRRTWRSVILDSGCAGPIRYHDLLLGSHKFLEAGETMLNHPSLQEIKCPLQVFGEPSSRSLSSCPFTGLRHTSNSKPCICFSPLEKSKHISSSDGFPLKATRTNKTCCIQFSKWKKL